MPDDFTLYQPAALAEWWTLYDILMWRTVSRPAFAVIQEHSEVRESMYYLQGQPCWVPFGDCHHMQGVSIEEAASIGLVKDPRMERVELLYEGVTIHHPDFYSSDLSYIDDEDHRAKLLVDREKWRSRDLEFHSRAAEWHEELDAAFDVARADTFKALKSGALRAVGIRKLKSEMESHLPDRKTGILRELVTAIPADVWRLKNILWDQGALCSDEGFTIGITVPIDEVLAAFPPKRGAKVEAESVGSCIVTYNQSDANKNRASGGRPPKADAPFMAALAMIMAREKGALPESRESVVLEIQDEYIRRGQTISRALAYRKLRPLYEMERIPKVA